MILSLSVYVVATKILFVASAPKLGYFLFDPLTYEAKAGPFSARKDSAVVKAPTTNTPADHDTANLILSESSEEFLENDENATEQIKNISLSTSTVVTTTQTTPTKVETPAPAPVLRSKSCFSCIGSLRTGDSVSIPLKSLPIYLRDNENQKGYPKFGYEFDEAVCKLVSNRILCGYNKNTGTIPNSKEEVHVDAECRIRGDRIECGYGNTNGGGGNGGKTKRTLKLQLPLTNENTTTFKLKDILKLGTIWFNETEQTQKVTVKVDLVPEETNSTPVKDDLVTKGILNTIESSKTLQTFDHEAYSTIIDTISDIPSTSTTATTTTVTTKITDTTTETDSKKVKTEIETETNSKFPLLSLRSIMKMKEDLEKLARQGSETETTEYVQAVTRCVEIGDRIVCYDYKPRPTTPAAALSSSASVPTSE